METKFYNLLSKQLGISKTTILRYIATVGGAVIADIAKETALSVPTVAKFIQELMDEGYIIDSGKQETMGGRKPNLYTLNPSSGYFAGVDVRKSSISLALIDFHGQQVFIQMMEPYVQSDNEEGLNQLCELVRTMLQKSGVPYEKIVAICFNISGRVNPKTGNSFSHFVNDNINLVQQLEQRLQIRSFIENDSRAMCYGEYMLANQDHVRDMLFINVSWGLGMGMILDGKPYYGASGFAGEFGHSHFFDNEIFCHCGKKGCLETEASGFAMHRLLMERHKAGARSILSPKIEANEPIQTEDLVEAIRKEDILTIDIVEEIASNLGRAISGLINIMNPQKVVIGGLVSDAGEYLLLPIQSAVKKYSLSLANKDTTIKLSSLGNKAGLLGACFIARNRMLGIL